MSAAIQNRTSSSTWFNPKSSPFIIAGPCSAESLGQVLETAKALASTNRVDAFRAGVWKPRTRPGSFEGIGAQALEWLKVAKEETGLSILTEVANANHVESALRGGLDMLWIGARTTVNPFYVQEIAESLKGVDIPVLVKNPLHPELGLWLGALERLEKSGVNKLAAIHRGFYTHQPAPFRNEPRWDVSFELRTHAPELPILCDPSHIAGDAQLIGEIAQTAMDINFDGLMIETHLNPSSALSDAKQQITPDTLMAILNKLVVKKEYVNETLEDELDVFRKEIDDLDNQILDILKHRNELIASIAEIKKADEMTIFQLNRWFDIMENRNIRGEKLELDADLVHELFAIIHKYSVNQQIEILRRK